MQIWMSVELVSVIAMKMPIAPTLKEAMTALVVKDSLAME